MRAENLRARLARQPFRPFRICISDATASVIESPRVIIVTGMGAIVPHGYVVDEDGTRLPSAFRTIAFTHMAGVEDVEL